MRFRRTVLLLSGFSLVAWLGARTWGFEESEAADVGLTGILAAYAPEGLSEDDFADLEESIDESWKEWTRETAQYVKDLYEGDHPTLESQREAVDRVLTKLKTVEKAMKDSRYRSIHAELRNLHGELAPRAELADAVLETLMIDPQKAVQERLGPSYGALRNSVRRLRSDMQRIRGGQAWLEWIDANALGNLRPENETALELVGQAKRKLEARETGSDEIRDFLSRESFLDLEDALADVLEVNASANTDQAAVRGLLIDLVVAVDEYDESPTGVAAMELRRVFDTVRRTAPDGGKRLERTMRNHYLNYNLQLLVSEGLMNRFLSESRSETGWINDRLMEAHVTGYQCTNANVSVDIRPNAENATFALNLDGTVNSTTRGTTHQATIHSRGYHYFHAEKSITFDGHDFTSQPTRVGVNPNTQTVGASTNLSGVPLFGAIADNIAFNTAVRRTPEANAYTAQQISAQVRRELDAEANEQFEQAAMDLEANTYGPLREYGLYPDVLRLNTTQNALAIRSRLMETGELGGSRPAPGTSVPNQGLVVQVHETLLTNGAERLDVAGKTMTEGELEDLIKERIKNVLGRELELPEPAEGETEDLMGDNVFVFDTQDPFRFVVDDGSVEVQIRAGLKRDNGDDIPVQVISVPFEVTLAGDKIVLTRGNVGVKPITRPSSVAEQVARANVMRQKIQSALPERELDATFELEQRGRKVALSVTHISAEAGWLTVTMN